MERQSEAASHERFTRRRAHDGESIPTPGKSHSSLQIAIAATFTADLVVEPLQFWMERLNIPADVALAPYAQVLQELLSPAGLFHGNRTGFNVLLIRLDDWIRERTAESDAQRNLDHIRATADELIAALEAFRSKSSSNVLVLFCPNSAALPAAVEIGCAEVQSALIARMTALPGVYCWNHADLLHWYPVVQVEDAGTDRLAHIPYTTEYFVAISTLLARGIAALVKPQYKVIAVDCDNTLWKGICGEDGPSGVELTESHIRFQQLLVQQHDAGMLLCLCSKNNPSDVDAVFVNHPEMPLREEHLVAARVNWDAKSENLQSLARDLGLGLDSFIFIDDSAMECAEVRAHCAGVLTIQFPESPQEIAHLLNHVWAFDRRGVTKEARRRTEQYKQNRARSAIREQAADLNQFLAALELVVDISAMQADELARVAELVQRTNQFNLTSVRRRASEIESLWRSGDLQILVVHVRDRFGDYGLVGALLYRHTSRDIDVDTFVLSCRALGRGVEHRIVNWLGQIATEAGLSGVILRYRSTPRSGPALMFLERSFEQFRRRPDDGKADEERVFDIPVDYARGLRNQSSAIEVVEDDSAAPPPVAAAAELPSSDWHDAAYQLSRIADVMREMARSATRNRATPVEYVPPRTSDEMAVADIWAEVLGVQKVGVHVDFFHLGGNSLLAIQAIARIGSVLGRELSVAEFFERPTVEDVAGRLAAAAHSGPAIQSIDRSVPSPMSWAQQRLWFIDQLEGGTGAYHMPMAIRLRGELNRKALQAALDSLVERHEALRTVFAAPGREPTQTVRRATGFALRVQDLRTMSADERASEERRHTDEEFTAPFDLTTGPLIRGRLIQLSDDEHLLLLTMHHIVSDGWSLGVLLRELGTLYTAHLERRQNPLPPLPIQYADYAQWQRHWLTGAELQKQLTYWRQQLRDAPELLTLPTDRPRAAMQTYRGASARIALGPDLSSELKDFSRRHNLTIAMTLCAAWSIVLAKLSGQDDVVLGMPVANRRRTEVEGLIGFFVNTLAMRVDLRDDPTVHDLLVRTRALMVAAYANQDVPFEQVVEAVQPARTLSHSPIFQVLFVLQNAPRGELQLPGLSLSEEEVSLPTAQFDVTLWLQESAEGIRGTLNYSSDLFDAATMERWVEHLEVVLRQIPHQPSCKVGSLSMVSGRQRRQVVELFNATHMDYPKEKLVHELFEEQVRVTPSRIAVSYERQSLTYAELNARANRLARCLRARGVGPERLVGICADRTPEMIVGLLGILKAGGAYLPLDPNYPQERLQHMVADGLPQLVLTQETLLSVLPTTAQETLTFDKARQEAHDQSEENLPTQNVGLSSRNLVYVIYTSGSTGRPKGTAMAHGSMVNLIQWHTKTLTADGQRVLQFAALSFDVAFQEIFTTLCTGGTLALLDDWIRKDVPALTDFLSKTRVERLFAPPLMLQALAEFSNSAVDAPLHLRDVITAGEQLRITPEIANFFKRLGGCRLHNHYGPTESHVVTALTLAPIPDAWPALPSIGAPIANSQIYILDTHLEPTAVGVSGEIFIGGAGVARGYLGRPQLTAQRFVEDPFAGETERYLYRTGDLGRWRADGTIEYQGRNDHQVKIRGFRIELGEIEAQLMRHPGVRESVVIMRDDSPADKRLVAYVVPAEKSRSVAAPGVEELRTHLKSALPNYMLPGAFVMIEHMPLNPNGKLDRNRLPVPDNEAYAKQEYAPPEGEVEEVLADIWQQLMHMQRIGRDDNFFELGGHSLLAMQVAVRIRSRLSIEMPVTMLFKHPTVKLLAANVEEIRNRRWLDSITERPDEVDDLLEKVAAMPDSEVERLMREFRIEGRGV